MSSIRSLAVRSSKELRFLPGLFFNSCSDACIGMFVCMHAYVEKKGFEVLLALGTLTLNPKPQTVVGLRVMAPSFGVGAYLEGQGDLVSRLILVVVVVGLLCSF